MRNNGGGGWREKWGLKVGDINTRTVETAAATMWEEDEQEKEAEERIKKINTFQDQSKDALLLLLPLLPHEIQRSDKKTVF